MIMRRGQPLLLPVSPLFIAMSLIVALLLNMFLSNLLGPSGVWLPDFLAVALVFWNVHQPRRISIGWAFFFGLLMDVHASALLSQHALAYSVLSYFAISMHRRLRWFPVDGQALQLIPLLLVAHLLQWLVRWLVGDGLPGWPALIAPALEAVLWPIATAVLLAPQRRAHNPDENRPI
jgi:rod shape-determining protein MreD